MKGKQLVHLALVGVAAVAFAACDDATQPSVLSDASLERDLAASSGDAIATEVLNLLGNEVFSGLPGAPSFGLFGLNPPDLTVSRTRTCYDAQGNVQSQCDQLTTASMRIQVTIGGTRIGDRFTAAVHRSRDLTISGLLGQETSRTHDGVGTSNDTVTFTGDSLTRLAAESAVDSVIAVVFNLPRATNPWPVSGRIVRVVNATITVTGVRNETRTISRRIEVIFPPDAQGNVPIRVGEKTCTLNLVTRRVTNCS